jgi:hypothetical protein
MCDDPKATPVEVIRHLPGFTTYSYRLSIYFGLGWAGGFEHIHVPWVPVVIKLLL